MITKKIVSKLSGAVFVLLSFLGCQGVPGTTNWTRHFQENPDKLEEFPHLIGAPLLGGVYELKKDMLIVSDPARNRFALVDFGTASFPRNVDDYHSGKGNQRGLHGILEAGTKIRGDRVERHNPRNIMTSVSTKQGVAYLILEGPHEGKLLIGPPLIRDSIAGVTQRVPPEMLEQYPNPELLREIKPPYLDIRGKPVKEESAQHD